jgi:dCMP deaminase
MGRLDWNKYFMAMAKLAATRSGCNSRPTGAVIVKHNRIISTGYNGTLPGQKQCTDHGTNFCLRRFGKVDDKGENKYQECPSIHAEQNAINQLAKNGGSNLENAHIFCTLFPCIFCLKNIASVGIKTVFYEIPYESDDPSRDEYWKKKCKEYKISTFQVKLTNTELNIIYQSVFNETSTRRL